MHAIFVTDDESVKTAIDNVRAIAAGHYPIHIFPSLEAARAWIKADRDKPA